MEIRKLITAMTVGAGTVVLLTKAQAAARSHLIVKAEGKALGKGKDKREPYEALQLLHFKANEELGIDGELDRHQERAFGLSPETATPSDAANADDLEALEKAKAEAEKAKAAADEAKVEAEKAKAEADEAKAEAEKAKAEADEALAKLDAAKAGNGDTSAQTGDQKPVNEADAKKGGASNETQNQTS
jgi:hypothetical protein